jgi:hypothetical protein
MDRAADAEPGPIPPRLIDRYGLDTRWYGKHIDAWGLPVLGPHHLEDATLVRTRAQLGTLLWTFPFWPVPELDRRDVRLVVIARGEVMSAIPDVLDRFGTRLDERYWGGFGATDKFPLSASTESNLMDDRGGENVFVHEFGHTVHLMSLQHIDPDFTPELTRAWDAALAADLWSNTYASSNIAEYFAEGAQIYFDVNFPGPPGGDGVHNDVNTRAELRDYDRPLFDLLDRVYRGNTLATYGAEDRRAL